MPRRSWCPAKVRNNRDWLPVELVNTVNSAELGPPKKRFIELLPTHKMKPCREGRAGKANKERP